MCPVCNTDECPTMHLFKCTFNLLNWPSNSVAAAKFLSLEEAKTTRGRRNTTIGDWRSCRNELNIKDYSASWCDFFFFFNWDRYFDGFPFEIRAWPWTFPVAVDVKCSCFLVISTLLTSLGAAVPLYNSL